MVGLAGQIGNLKVPGKSSLLETEYSSIADLVLSSVSEGLQQRFVIGDY